MRRGYLSKKFKLGRCSSRWFQVDCFSTLLPICVSNWYKICFLLVYLGSSFGCIMPFPPKIYQLRILVCPVSYTLIRAGVAVQGPLAYTYNLYASLLSRGFSMETLGPHEYDIPVVRGGSFGRTTCFRIFDTYLPLRDMVPNVRGIHAWRNE